MATLSSILAWKNPRTEEPGGLQSMGSQKSQIMTEHEDDNHSYLFTISSNKIFLVFLTKKFFFPSENSTNELSLFTVNYSLKTIYFFFLLKYRYYAQRLRNIFPRILAEFFYF